MGRGITPGGGSPWWVKDTALPILCSVSALSCHQKFVTLPSTATDQSDIFTELVCISSCIFAFLSPPRVFTGFRSPPWAQSASIQFALPFTRFEAPTTSINIGCPQYTWDSLEQGQSRNMAEQFLCFPGFFHLPHKFP